MTSFQKCEMLVKWWRYTIAIECVGVSNVRILVSYDDSLSMETVLKLRET